MFKLNNNKVTESEIRNTHSNSSIPFPMELRHIEHWGYTEEPDLLLEPFVEEQVTRVTMRQARLALKRFGVYKQVNDGVSSLGEEAQIEWEYALSVDKDSLLVKQMQQALNLTDKQVDDLFELASSL